MKRLFSLVLAMILLSAHLTGPLTAAFAEEAAPVEAEATVEAAAEDDGEALQAFDIVSDDGDQPGAGAALASLSEDEVELIPDEAESEALVFDLGDLIAEDMAIEEEDEDAEAALPEAAASLYGRVSADEAPVCGADGAAFAWAAGGSVLLTLDTDEEGRVQVAFDTDRGVVEGWTDADLLTPLTDAEIYDYMDAVIAAGPVCLYCDDPNMPMLRIDCRFDAADPEPETEAPAAEPAEETETEAEADGEGAPEPQTEDEAVVVEPEAPAGEPEAPAPEAAEDVPEIGLSADGLEAEPAADPDDAPVAPDAGEAPEAAEDGMFTFDDAAFSLNADSVELAVGDSWTIQAWDAEGQAIAPEQLTIVNNGNCVSLVGATVTGVCPGETEITVSYCNESLTVAVSVLALAESISLTQSRVVIGEQQRYSELGVNFPSNTTAQVTFESSNPNVAHIDAQSGVITGVAAGSASIVASVTGSGATASCAVTVEKAPETVSLNPASVALGEGDEWQLNASVPKGAHQEPLTWTSTNKRVAEVEDGRIVALSKGTATVTVTTYNGVSAACAVTVALPPAQVVMAPTVTMYKGQKFTPAYSVLDANDGDCDVARLSFSSNDTTVATVSRTGKITAKAEGTAVITATAYNGVENSLTLTVRPAVSSLSLSLKGKPSTGYIGVGQTWSGWKVTKSPSNAYAASYAYSSTNSAILKILDARTGKFKALKKGTAYIRVTSANGKTAVRKIVVRKAPTRIALSPLSGRLQVGKSARYRIKLYGAGGSYTFTSSNPKVATVTNSGKVKALKAGTTKITLRTYNGKKKTATLRVYPKNYAGMPGYLISNTSSYKAGMSDAQKIEYVIYVAQNKLGCRYVWGSFGPSRFDCSGLTYYCFTQVGAHMENSAYRQGYLGSYRKITKVGSLRRGDLVCFNTVKDGDRCDHVGIYLGNGYFIHASSSAGKVIISQFKSKSTDYYLRHFSWGRRILG